ncbi:MAG: hypothetical protein Q7S40_04665 [Opitutaceae bacterium]|nr:hypothetical protein [Opitutaceae bacterium]
MKIRIAATIVLLALDAGVSRAAIEFSSYMQTEEQSTFVLTDTEDARSSGWLAIGQSFRGYTLIAFDRKSEVLSVRNGDTTIRLPLKPSRVKHVDSKLPELIRQLTVTKAELTEMRRKAIHEHASASEGTTREDRRSGAADRTEEMKKANPEGCVVRSRNTTLVERAR